MLGIAQLGMDWMLGMDWLGMACLGLDKRGFGGHLASLDFNSGVWRIALAWLSWFWNALAWLRLDWHGLA
jgi:hypothetical protein